MNPDPRPARTINNTQRALFCVGRFIRRASGNADSPQRCGDAGARAQTHGFVIYLCNLPVDVFLYALHASALNFFRNSEDAFLNYAFFAIATESGQCRGIVLRRGAGLTCPRAMTRIVRMIFLPLAMLLVGCSNRQTPPLTDRVTIFVPGVAGDGGWYDGLFRELSSDGPVQVMTWGAPKAAFFANFSDEAIHDKAEKALAEKIEALPASVTRIDLVAHSAGCGVVLGGVAKSGRAVDSIVLLAPSVSPAYDLRPALKRMRGRLNVFYSDQDVTFLKWRTSTFGTYDRTKTPAAGHLGFDLASLDDDAQRQRIHQFACNPDWKKLGNDGDHFGPVAAGFIREVVLPLLRHRDDAR